MSSAAVLVLLAALPAAAQNTAGWGWNWRMPVGKYQQLGLSERASVDRASDLYERGEKAFGARKDQEGVSLFRASAIEWKRFGIEYMDAPEYALAYASFMQAHSLRGARDRNKAVELYTETLDLYAETEEIAVNSLFWRARSHESNGDIGKAIADDREIIETYPDSKLPLVLVAMRNISWNAWNAGRYDEAGDIWRDLLDRADPKKSPDIWNSSYNDYITYLNALGDWEGLSAFIEKNAGGNERNQADQIGRIASDNSRRPGWLRNNYWAKTKPKGGVDRAIRDYKTANIKWHDGYESLFVSQNRGWEFLRRSFDLKRDLDPSKSNDFAMELVKRLRTDASLDAKTRENRARDVMEMLKSLNLLVAARSLLDMIPDGAPRLWALYSIEDRASNLPAAFLVLDQIEKLPDQGEVRRARRTRADLYKNRTREYEKAIPIYAELSDPPETLWRIQECYRALGKKNEAQSTLTEIASMFPDQAARAMFVKAGYYNQDGNKKEAIAHYRRIMAHSDWKKSQESSLAHQELEKMGIATGGAVINEVR